MMSDNGVELAAESSGCYCGEKRKLGTPELQCSICSTWFHNSCLNIQTGKCLPFMISYQFNCKKCSGIGHETFQKRQATFIQICQMTLANLLHNAKTEGVSKTIFSKDRDIIPFIEKHWESLTTMQRRVKVTWHTTIYKTMMKETDVFTYKEEVPGDSYFGLVNQDLSKVGPCSDAARINAQPSTNLKTPLMPLETGPGKRTSKRKAPIDSQQTTALKQKKSTKSFRSDSSTSLKLPSHGYPLEHPFNKDGYRYILAETDPHAPNRQAFDESVEWAGKPIPGYLYRCMLGSEVLLALHDRAPQLKVSEDRYSVTGDKGYSMIRASHGISQGSWYFEVTVVEMPNDSASRIGWSLSLGNLQAPCGYDKFSYSWRSRKGTAFHQSRGHHYHDGGYGEGDVLGFYISLPKPDDPELVLPQTYKDRPLVKFKSHLYFEDKDNVSETEKTLKPAKGSKMIMYKNGQSAGVAFSDVFEGLYYPALSLFKNASVTANFGPKFKYPPKGLDYKAISEVAEQAHVDYALADIVYHVENENNIPDFL
ncbi:set1/Ash2 histone methyltransferase complex subunit ASH2-like isoform X1 [Biomphalaria glabrata]|uniref:Set1/Ash2 histone methyltransferase complex subunit ASH2-like isoform X1 n=1 Tax=Biomphalaria glabrata TaxID=6526 RepID=A0A2C9JRB0_BIOGL|nr:set1/Ash2 histone methyltransferase complex subunit ASH2-like isoform X1 [Biomphalaria glabrata]XP_013078812.1 set1/Ash2 histone methyltransferase complex subunit ASH2-like isoform X1 [Biomphalaria glabrata]XP_055875906.1 set1/Ash2 histone methyltransferase complex subunit ASH2-like isoform X1 [Biomphalaria glabrata]XP_055875907.1 set1/Ash2 histone methyltransferase complex subunit ASH2-like isoform X1 [Biomphalaria glabrata]XP_055875909.1 set1/Ash2 histone methyltransferase complex subunit 